MTLKSIVECEKRQLEKLKKFQLPNNFKKTGLIIAVLCFSGLFVNRFTIDSEILRVICKYAFVLGLLLISISKEKIEDELIIRVRMTSYSFAFIFVVLWSFVSPFLSYAIENLIGSRSVTLQENGDFVILGTLLMVQVALFHIFKKAA